MKTKIYWKVENNADLIILIENLSDAEKIISDNYESESEGGFFSIDDLQYSITPVVMTKKQFEETNNRYHA